MHDFGRNIATVLQDNVAMSRNSLYFSNLQK